MTGLRWYILSKGLYYSRCTGETIGAYDQCWGCLELGDLWTGRAVLIALSKRWAAIRYASVYAHRAYKFCRGLDLKLYNSRICYAAVIGQSPLESCYKSLHWSSKPFGLRQIAHHTISNLECLSTFDHRRSVWYRLQYIVGKDWLVEVELATWID